MSATSEDGMIRTEKEKTGCTTDTTKFRDEQSGQKRKKTATKVTRENVKTEVSDNGVDPEIIKKKFEGRMAGLQAPGDSANSGKTGSITGTNLQSNLRSKEWFEEMMKNKEERWSKFSQENKHRFSENSQKMFSKFWDDQAQT